MAKKKDPAFNPNTATAEQTAQYLEGILHQGGGEFLPVGALEQGGKLLERETKGLAKAGEKVEFKPGPDLKKELKTKLAQKATDPTAPSGDKSGMSAAEEKKYLAPGDPKNLQAQGPTTQQAIDQLMSTYMNELNQLGPEYNNEMSFLQPYMMPTQETMSSLTAQSKANESPTGDTGVMAADTAAGKAASMQYGVSPGFNNLAGAAKSYEGSLQYGDLLSTLLAAGKNQILGYSSIPNLSSINTQGMPPAVQSAYNAAVQGLGYNSSTGLPNPQTAANQAAQSAQYNAAANPGTAPTQTGGGNA